MRKNTDLKDILEHHNWAKVEVLATGDRYFSELLTSFRHAQKHIQIETYIFNIDSVTRVLLDELVKAQERGVRVQILVDGFGSFMSVQTLDDFCRRKNIEFRVYQPFPFGFSGIFAYAVNFFRLFRRLNRRNHRKIVVIDGTVAYVGSMNWTHVHSRRAFGNGAWRDTAVKVEGPPIEILNHAFKVSWYRALKLAFKRFRKKPPLLKHYDPRRSLVRLNTSLRDRWRLHHDLIHRIRTAEKRVLLTTAYFLPHRALMLALKKAAQRGISVSVLVPGASDVPLVKWAAFELGHNLLKAGVKIYEYQATNLHAKVMLVDDWATVGSTNLNYRSFLHDLEVEVVLKDRESLETLQEQWNQDIQNSVIFDIKTYESASWLRRLISQLAFRLRYLL
jgi:cardiolipin synthase